MKTADKKIKGFNKAEGKALEILRLKRTNTPSKRADCEKSRNTPCTAFGCKFNLTTEVAFKNPSEALKLLIAGINKEIRNNCLLDLVEFEQTYDIPEIAELLRLTPSKVEAVLRSACNKIRVHQQNNLSEHL
jgi:hypothetical protein